MFRSIKSILAATLLAGAAVLAAPSSADAAFTLRISAAGHADLVIVDGGAGDDNATPGNISVDDSNATVNAFRLATGFDIRQVSTSFTNGLAGGQLSIITDTENNIERTGAGSSVVTITSGFDGFTLPLGSELLLMGPSPGNSYTFSLVTPGATGDFRFQNFIDNVPPAMDLINPTGNGGDSGTVALGSSGSVGPTLFSRTTASFQVVNRSTLELGSGDVVSFTTSSLVVATPAPAGLIMALTGLPVFGVGAWVRRRKTAATA